MPVRYRCSGGASGGAAAAASAAASAAVMAQLLPAAVAAACRRQWQLLHRAGLTVHAFADVALLSYRAPCAGNSSNNTSSSTVAGCKWQPKTTSTGMESSQLQRDIHAFMHSETKKQEARIQWHSKCMAWMMGITGLQRQQTRVMSLAGNEHAHNTAVRERPE